MLGKQRYVTNMGELFRMTEGSYWRFMVLVANGTPVHEALAIVKAVSICMHCENVTDLDDFGAKIILKSEGKIK